MDQAQQCFEDVQGVNQVLAEPSEALSEGLENEYDELLGEIDVEEKKANEARELDLKEQMMSAGSVPSHKLPAHKQAVPSHGHRSRHGHGSHHHQQKRHHAHHA
mgnify:CR=1 FL=1